MVPFFLSCSQTYHLSLHPLLPNNYNLKLNGCSGSACFFPYLQQNQPPHPLFFSFFFFLPNFASFKHFCVHRHDNCWCFLLTGWDPDVPVHSPWQPYKWKKVAGQQPHENSCPCMIRPSRWWKRHAAGVSSSDGRPPGTPAERLHQRCLSPGWCCVLLCPQEPAGLTSKTTNRWVLSHSPTIIRCCEGPFFCDVL